MNKLFITFLKKSQSRVKICIGLCLVLIFSICSGSLNTYADDTYYTTSATFYTYHCNGNYYDEDIISITNDYQFDMANLCYNGILQSIGNVLQDWNLDNFLNDTETDNFLCFNEVLYDYNLRNYIFEWCDNHYHGSCGYQLVRYNNTSNNSLHCLRFILYFFQQGFDYDIESQLDGTAKVNFYPNFTIYNNNTGIIFPYTSKFGFTIQDSTGSFYNYPISYYQPSSNRQTFNYNISNCFNTSFNGSVSGSYDTLDENNLPILNNNDQIIAFDFFLGDYFNQMIYNMAGIYENSFPLYSIGSGDSNYVVSDIVYGSFGSFTVINVPTGLTLTNSNNRSYITVSGNVYTPIQSNHILDLSSVEVTPSPSPSGSPVITDTPLPTNPIYTPSPQYTQVPYYTQAPYYTQMPYPTQSPYYTQMPYPTQRPYYTQIPYPSGLNDLGELTDKLLTPIPNPTGSDLSYYDFDLDSVNINLNNDLTNSQSKNFFFAFISILWDKMNLLCFGYFALALGLIFIWYLLGHGRRG